MIDERGKARGVIVLGPYRSGTSVTSQVLNALGVDFGPKSLMVPANRYNPGGHFERIDMNHANDALIHYIGKTLGDPGDPVELASAARPEAFELADMSWLTTKSLWGIKDPRLCATLLAWIESGRLKREEIVIVHIRRNLDDAVRSAMEYVSVRGLCDGTEAGVRQMLHRYDVLAQWHVETLGVSAITIDYESLLKESRIAVEKLADFIGVSDPRRIRRATSLIGKGKGMFRLQLVRYFFRAPRRLYRLLTGTVRRPNR